MNNNNKNYDLSMRGIPHRRIQFTIGELDKFICYPLFLVCLLHRFFLSEKMCVCALQFDAFKLNKLNLIDTNNKMFQRYSALLLLLIWSASGGGDDVEDDDDETRRIRGKKRMQTLN